MKKDYYENLDIIWDKETREQAERYFEKYWLDRFEYIEKWLQIKNTIFDDKAKFLPDMMFNERFEIFPLVGGDIFVSEHDFMLLKRCMRQTGDTHFITIQNERVVVGNHFSESNFKAHPLTRFKYPMDISWEELLSGGIFGAEHLNNGCKDFYVFGTSGTWGRYVANSWIKPSNSPSLTPLNLMGFRKEFSGVFVENFKELRTSEPEINLAILKSKWLPDSYELGMI